MRAYLSSLLARRSDQNDREFDSDKIRSYWRQIAIMLVAMIIDITIFVPAGGALRLMGILAMAAIIGHQLYRMLQMKHAPRPTPRDYTRETEHVNEEPPTVPLPVVKASASTKRAYYNERLHWLVLFPGIVKPTGAFLAVSLVPLLLLTSGTQERSQVEPAETESGGFLVIAVLLGLLATGYWLARVVVDWYYTRLILTDELYYLDIRKPYIFGGQSKISVRVINIQYVNHIQKDYERWFHLDSGTVLVDTPAQNEDPRIRRRTRARRHAKLSGMIDKLLTKREER